MLLLLCCCLQYNRIYVRVKPLMDSLERAQGERTAAQAELDAANDKVAKVEANLRLLEGTLAEAQAKKAAAEDEALRCSQRLAMANRLVNGLSSENDRWKIEVAKLRETETMLIGDVLLASAFVSYIGAFNNSACRHSAPRILLAQLLHVPSPILSAQSSAAACGSTRGRPTSARAPSRCPRPSTRCSC